jgi:hypothetical protein
MPHLRYTDIDIGTFGNTILAELLLRETVATTAKRRDATPIISAHPGNRIVFVHPLPKS